LLVCSALDACEKLGKFVSRGQRHILLLAAGAAVVLVIDGIKSPIPMQGKNLTNQASAIRL